MNNNVFNIANEVIAIVEEKKPGLYVPFRGNFPLLKPYNKEEFWQIVSSEKKIDEVPEWVQDILFKALNVKRIDDGFRDFLKMNGIFNEWLNMSSSDKSTELMRFLNANSMTLEYLDI
jgi:hypothetical protein